MPEKLLEIAHALGWQDMSEWQAVYDHCLFIAGNNAERALRLAVIEMDRRRQELSKGAQDEQQQ